MNSTIKALLRDSGVVAAAHHPNQRSAVRRAVTTGDLVPVLPGVYAQAHDLKHDQRAAALMAAYPEAVLVGESAASLLGWPGLEPPATCVAALPHRCARPGYRFIRRHVWANDIIEQDGIRVTTAALTALDLARERGAQPLDDALRLGVPLEDLREAYDRYPGRRGNTRLRALLLDSRDRPWSEAERAAHRALREAGLEAWFGNYRVTVGGHTYHVDIAFPEARLAIEIDGRAFHAGWDQRIADSARDRALVAEGWRVLRFPAVVVLSDPEVFLKDVSGALAA